MLMYAQDYDERLPRSRGWSDVVYPYIKSKGIFLCPAVRGDRPGYAVNAPLDVLSLSRFESCAHTVMLFDSDALVRNAADRGGSWPVPPRHSGGNNAAYVDGHVKWLRDKPDFAVSLQPR